MTGTSAQDNRASSYSRQSTNPFHHDNISLILPFIPFVYKRYILISTMYLHIDKTGSKESCFFRNLRLYYFAWAKFKIHMINSSSPCSLFRGLLLHLWITFCRMIFYQCWIWKRSNSFLQSSWSRKCPVSLPI